ncbi:MAG TPA: ABC transporter ATP-binding protein, partial [Acidimicrobiales bacterium]
MVELDHVSKWFGDVVAVSDVSFTIGPGITALLGPNGAGKSTVLRLLCGLARPSQGRVRVLDGDPRRDVSLFARIGLVAQQEAMFDAMRPVEFVRAAARLLRVPAPGEAAEAALNTVELDPADRRPSKALSKGNRQRVKVAAALVHDPAVLVLDEPLNGLDPRQRHHLIDLVRKLGERPDRCVVLSSHVLDEV